MIVLALLIMTSSLLVRHGGLELQVSSSQIDATLLRTVSSPRVMRIQIGVDVHSMTKVTQVSCASIQNGPRLNHNAFLFTETSTVPDVSDQPFHWAILMRDECGHSLGRVSFLLRFSQLRSLCTLSEEERLESRHQS